MKTTTTAINTAQIQTIHHNENVKKVTKTNKNCYYVQGQITTDRLKNIERD